MNDLVDLVSVCAEDFDPAFLIGSQRPNVSRDLDFDIWTLVGRLLCAHKPVAVVAAMEHSFAGLANSMLIIGSGHQAHWSAADALLEAIGARKR